MFAKLKKKIEEGGNSVGDGPTQGPGVASPLKVSTRGKDSVDYEAASASSEISEVKATTSKEDLFKKIMKKNEQIKRLEAKITDLATMIKDRNRSIERLELALEKQKADYEKQIQELDMRYQRERSRHSSGSSPSSAKTSDPFSTEVTKLEKENAKLLARIKELEMREKTIQEDVELSTLNELLTCSQKDLETSQGQLKETTHRLTKSEKRANELEDEIHSLMSQIGTLTSNNEKLEERLRSVEEREKRLQSESTEAEQKLQDYKTKSDQELSLREERLSQSRERVRVLEQRLEQSSLSGDDQLSALKAERDDYEKKLQEVREQLTHARTAATERSTQLLQQVTQLNTCLTEERTGRSQLEAKMAVEKDEQKSVIEKLQKEVKGLKSQLSSRDKQLEKSVDEKRQVLEEERKRWQDKEAALSASIAQLTKQLEDTENTRQLDKASAEQKLALAVEAEGIKISRERDKLKQQLADLKKEQNTSQNEKDELLVRNATLSQEFEAFKRKALSKAEDGRAEIQHKNHAIAGLESVLQDMQAELAQAKSKVSELEKAQTVAINEVESAEVTRLQEQVKVQEEQLTDRNKTIKKQAQRLADLKKTLQRELNIQTLPNDELPDTPPPLGGRGVRDQSPAGGSLTNGYAYGARNGRRPSQEGQSAASLQVSSSSTVQLGRTGSGNVGPHGSDTYFGHNASPLATNYDSDVSDLNSALASRARGPAATRQATGSKIANAPTRSGGRTGPLEYNRDINFDYLRHVVLKFMLSRESEAVHLIKAVAMLLDFTVDEQRLLKDTLEYKMSWFGTRPKLGEGQFSKYVPPTV